MRYRLFSLPLILTVVASASVTVTLVDPSPQQVHIRFVTTDAPTSCTVDIYEALTPTQDVHATDPTLFAGANEVSTANSVILNGTVNYIGGSRMLATGLDGNAYSLSLSEDQLHNYKIICPSQTVTGSFQTLPIPQGMTHQDAQYPDPAHPGKVWSPTFSQNSLGASRQQTVIDPYTGARIHSGPLQADFSIPFGGSVDLAYDTTGSTTDWTIPGAWTYGSNTTYATTTSTDSMFVGVINAGGNANFNCPDGMCNPYTAPGELGFSLWANTDNPACTGTSIPACQMTVQITVDGQSAHPNAKLFTQTITTTNTQYTFGASQVNDVGQKTGSPIWSSQEYGLHNGNATCTGTSTLTHNVDMKSFDPNVFVPGGYMWLDFTNPVTGTNYHKITGNLSSMSVTIADTCPNGSHIVGGSGFGWLVSRAASDSFHLNVANPTVSGVQGQFPIPENNFAMRGSPLNATSVNGNPAQLIFMKAGFMAIDRVTGDTWNYANTQSNSIPGFDTNSPNSPIDTQGYYWYFNPLPGHNLELRKAKYTGDYTVPTTFSSCCGTVPLWSWFGFQTLQGCTGGPPPTNQPCWDDQLVASNIGTMVQAFDATFDPTYFNSKIILTENGDTYISFFHANQSQDIYDWEAVFDPTAMGSGSQCVGGTGPGCVVAASPRWLSPGARWMLDKSPEPNLRPGWLSNQSAASGGDFQTGQGPMIAVTTTSVSSVTCPTGFASFSCVQVTVDGDPYDFASGIGTRGKYGTYAVGDYLEVGQFNSTPFGLGIPAGAPLGEIATIVGTNPSVLTIACIFVSQGGGCPSGASGQTIYMISNNPGNFPPYSNNGIGLVSALYWNWASDPHGTNTTGQTVVPNLSSAAAHNFTANSLFASPQCWSSSQPRCASTNQYIFQNFRNYTDGQLATAYTSTASNQQTGDSALFAPFAGIHGSFGSYGDNSFQSHPYPACMSQIDPRCFAAQDMRIFEGVHGVYSSMTKVSGTTSIYKVVPANPIHPKFFDTVATSGSYSFANVSGPSIAIQDGSAGQFTECYAVLANECVTGSSPGDYYANWYLGNGNLDGSGDNCYFHGNGEADGLNDAWFMRDFCGPADRIPEMNMLVSLGTDRWDNDGRLTYTYMSTGLGATRGNIFSSVFMADAKTAANGYPTWAFYDAQCVGAGTGCQFLRNFIRMPRWTTDSINHADFVPVTVHVSSLPPGASTVAVKFWYKEYRSGACSWNYDAPCFAVSNTVNETTPFYWPGETFTGSAPGDIAIPGLSGHMVHFRIVGLDGANNVVWSGQEQVTRVQ